MATTEKPWGEKEYLLEKTPFKGGWTYTVIPEIPQDKHAPFGWVKVRGSIDGVEIRNYHLMPSGNGDLLLCVKAEIRKKIGKQAGDTVRVILYPDDEPAEVPEEILICLQQDEQALRFFHTLSESEQQNFVRWINSAKTDRTKVDRIAKTLTLLSGGRKFSKR